MEENGTTITYASLINVINVFLEKLDSINVIINYRLIGSSASLIQGVNLPVNDIDILVKERKDLDLINKQLMEVECTLKPSWLSDSQQYFGSYRINTIDLEISTVEHKNNSDTIESFGNGPWIHYLNIPCGRYMIPTVTLELRLITELKRNRPEKYNPIIEHLKKSGCDIAYLVRAFEEQNINKEVKEKILNYLQLKMVCIGCIIYPHLGLRSFGAE